ncbi:hypothetical protein TrVE_jg3619 [Triparma verrucosa]|uniref:AmmeMemoRadiSam system protein B n=1 Tax=Triparma verrucosa TaxID=1606542 RepID=A0A9W7C9X5_9STRA|nr:hypothetical protein TrVE_jg3619 [Triparma verrucosa]
MFGFKSKNVDESTRHAAHAGSWYPSSEKKLRSNLESYLSTPSNTPTFSQQSLPSSLTPSAIISPHAGYSYSGPTAGATYTLGLKSRLLNPSLPPLRTIYVLHPSHHVYVPGIAISDCSTIRTPLGDLTVDNRKQKQIGEQLTSLGVSVQTMSSKTDASEHSSEMQYPLIKHLIGDLPITIVPIMIGSASQSSLIGTVLSPHIFSPSSFTVISSDFCHWGNRFQYTPFIDSKKISQSITELDGEGMTEIERVSPGGFAEYIKRTSNTICGRCPIECFLQAAAIRVGEGKECVIKFVRYEKSSEVEDSNDSSVSYAGGVCYI